MPPKESAILLAQTAASTARPVAAASKESRFSRLSAQVGTQVYNCLEDGLTSLSGTMTRLIWPDPVQYESIEDESRLDEVIRANYTIEGNVEHIRDAEIICLGENHLRDDHRRVNGLVINSLNRGSAGDALLVESKPSQVTGALQQGRYVKKTMSITGWDNRDTLAAKSIIAGSALGLGIALADTASLLYSPSTLLSFDGLRAVFRISALVGGACVTAVAVSLLVEKTLVGSNVSMCQTIEQQRTPEGRVFVLAGAAHFSNIGPFSPQGERAVSVLQDYLKDKKHIILSPKYLFHSPPDLPKSA